jgi:predicted nucleic acid-binding Zn ribbon protein
MRDESLTECPECGGELRKVFAPPVITFKGSGFYATDYRRHPGRAGDKDAAEAKSSTGGSEKSASGAAESKPSGESKSAGEQPSTSSSEAGSRSGGSPTKDASS